MVDQPPGHEPERPPPVGPAIAITLGVMLLWVVLTGLRPGTTFHLAPALVAWAPPWVGSSGTTTVDWRRQAAYAGGVAAVVTGPGLAAIGRLDGPGLFGASALVETLVVAVVATLAGLAWWGRDDRAND